MRILSSDVAGHFGETIHIEGWLHKKRLLGGLTFINVRDRCGLTQVVITEKGEVEKLRGLQIGTVLAVDGSVTEEPRAPGGAELHDAKLTVLVPVTDEPPIEIDKPIQHKAENLDTLFDNRVLNIRNLQEQKIFRLRGQLTKAIREFLDDHELLDIEMGFVQNHEEVLDMVGDMTQYALKTVYEQFGDDLKSLNAPELLLPKDGKIPRFTVAQIHEMYGKANNVDLSKEKDLIPDEERWISEHARKNLGTDLVFATEFPIEAAKFYHKVDAEKGVTMWADLLFRGLEIATCPLRENNYDTMIDQMTKAGLDSQRQRSHPLPPRY
jgi:aspartyl/asparaginyl-tRNA synthetase